MAESLLFDAHARRHALNRRAGATFLQDRAALEVSERLNEVNRTFTRPVIIGPEASLWARQTGLETAHLLPESETYDLTAEAHDLVISGLHLHWANDPVGQLIQMRRALCPDGLMIAVLFGGQTLHELRACLAEAEIEVTGGLSPRIAPMGEIRDLGGLLQRAGFALPVADGDKVTVTYDTPFALMQELRAMGERNILCQRLRRFTRRSVFVRMSQIYAARFGTADMRIPATFELITLTGWAPSDTQQKPLRPGSAKMRLAEALNVPEEPLSDKAKP